MFICCVGAAQSLITGDHIVWLTLGVWPAKRIIETPIRLTYHSKSVISKAYSMDFHGNHTEHSQSLPLAILSQLLTVNRQTCRTSPFLAWLSAIQRLIFSNACSADGIVKQPIIVFIDKLTTKVYNFWRIKGQWCLPSICKIKGITIFYLLLEDIALPQEYVIPYVSMTVFIVQIMQRTGNIECVPFISCAKLVPFPEASSRHEFGPIKAGVVSQLYFLWTLLFPIFCTRQQKHNIPQSQ